MGGFVASNMNIYYIINEMTHSLRRQHIISSFTGQVPDAAFFFRAPSLASSYLCAARFCLWSVDVSTTPQSSLPPRASHPPPNKQPQQPAAAGHGAIYADVALGLSSAPPSSFSSSVMHALSLSCSCTSLPLVCIFYFSCCTL